MDESAEAPEPDNQAAAPEEPVCGDGEPTSFAARAKTWHETHKPKIQVALGVALAVGLSLVVAAHRHEGQDDERYGVEDIGNPGPVLDREATDMPRKSAPYPEREPFLRRLSANQQASDAARERYRELTGNDLPPGHTVVSR